MKTLYVNGTILPMTGEDRRCEALLTEGGKILFAGARKEAEALCGEAFELVDLAGKTLLPAFIDPHSHFFQTAQGIAMCDLSQAESFDEIIALLKDYLTRKNISADGVVFGTGYDHNFLAEGRHPDRRVLDQVSATVPIYISHASGHMGAANSALLALAGLTNDTPDPQGGRFGRLEDGSLSGYVEETPALMPVIMKAMPRIKADMPAQLMETQQLYLSNGITTVQEGAAALGVMKGLCQFADHGALKLDVVAYVMAEDYPAAAEVCADRRETYRNHLRLGGSKIILDGSPQGKSAWLTQPYEGEETFCGYPTHKDEEVVQAASAAIANGCQLLAHCNGDAASQQFIDCYKKALSEAEHPEQDLRPVMVHCQTVRADQLDEMKAIGMLPTVFVGHTYYWGDIHLTNLGQQRGSSISPVRWMKERGMRFTFHQDTPVTAPNMLHSIWCAVNRVTRRGQSIGSEQRIGVYDALKAVTVNAAYQYHEEGEKGTLEPGKRADLVILSRDPLTCPPAELCSVSVVETIKDGVRVWSSEK